MTGTAGGVLLFDPTTGRFGFLDATTNEVRARTTLEVSAFARQGRQQVAGSPGWLWAQGRSRATRSPTLLTIE